MDRPIAGLLLPVRSQRRWENVTENLEDETGGSIGYPSVASERSSSVAGVTDVTIRSAITRLLVEMALRAGLAERLP